MKGRRQKSRHPAAALAPLPPEKAAALQEQVARLQEALTAGSDPESLAGLVTREPADLAWDLHLLKALEKMPHPHVPGLLAALFGHSADKERQKALKRTLHVLKTKGLTVPAGLFFQKDSTSPAPAETSVLQAQISSFMGDGERYVIFEGPRQTLGGNLLVARLSDRSGFRECHLLNLNRKQREEFWEHFHSEGLTAWTQAPPSYVLRLLEDALAITPDGEPGRAAYLPLRDTLWRQVGRPEDAPALEELLPSLGPGDHRGYLEQSRRLATSDLCRSWLPGPEEIMPWLKKLQETQNSPLVLSEQQQRLRQEGLLDDAAAALFPQETRGLWARRLLETAYFLDLSGRPEDARSAQAAAEDLLAGERSALKGENPFIQELVRYALMMAYEFVRQQEPQTQPSLLASPTEPLIRR
ncbi:MAG: hypothetical protein WAU47_07465 [Desulfobaccales bacterium]